MSDYGRPPEGSKKYQCDDCGRYFITTANILTCPDMDCRSREVTQQ